KGLKKLKTLNLGETKLTNLGLEHAGALTSLETLDLHGTLITDAGMAHLKPLGDLKKLILNNTKISDAGIKHLDGLDNLDELQMWGTEVKITERPRKLKPPVSLAKLKPAAPVAMIERLDGKLEKDAAGKAIVAVTFQNAQITDLDLAELRDLK